MDRADSAAGQDGPSAEPGRPQRTRRRRARHPGALSLGYFSLGKQREVTGAQGCATKTQGRESVVATEPQEHKGKELDPGLRRDDEVGAFAGMTKSEGDDVGGG